MNEVWKNKEQFPAGAGFCRWRGFAIRALYLALQRTHRLQLTEVDTSYSAPAEV